MITCFSFMLTPAAGNRPKSMQQPVYKALLRASSKRPIKVSPAAVRKTLAGSGNWGSPPGSRR